MLAHEVMHTSSLRLRTAALVLIILLTSVNIASFFYQDQWLLIGTTVSEVIGARVET